MTVSPMLSLPPADTTGKEGEHLVQTAFSRSQESYLPPSLCVRLLLSTLFIFLLKLLMITDIFSEKLKSIDIYVGEK